MHRLNYLSIPLLIALTACVSKTTGNEGNFEFSYAADDRIGDFNKPLAVGAFLDLEVRDVGDRSPIELSSAAFVDPGTLDVVSFAGHRITITGVASGNTLLEVAGTSSAAGALTDSVNMLARVPEVVKLRHTCDTAAGAAYLTSQRVYVPFDMEMANSQPVIGYGYYPATASDAAALTFNADASGQLLLAYDTGAAAAVLTLDSDLDATSLDVTIATEAEITGVEEPIAYVLEDIDVGDINSFYVRPLAGALTICQANVTKNVVSDTPGICTVTDREPESDTGDLAYEFGWFQIEGVAEGTCNYTVTFPAGNDGAGASAQFSYPIQP
jgi:hypothetical protein